MLVRMLESVVKLDGTRLAKGEWAHYKDVPKSLRVFGVYITRPRLEREPGMGPPLVLFRVQARNAATGKFAKCPKPKAPPPRPSYGTSTAQAP